MYICRSPVYIWIYIYPYVYRYFWPDRDTTPKSYRCSRRSRNPEAAPVSRVGHKCGSFLFMKLPINACWQGFPFHSSTCPSKDRVRHIHTLFLCFSFSHSNIYYYIFSFSSHYLYVMLFTLFF